MKRISLLICFCGCILTAFGQANTSTSIEGELLNCKGSQIFLLERDGSQYKPIASTQLEPNDGTFRFAFALENPAVGMYHLSLGRGDNARMLLVQAGESMKITGQCDKLKQTGIWQSKINRDYALVSRRNEQLSLRTSRLIGRMRGATGEAEAKVIAEMKALDETKLRMLDSLKQHNPVMAKLVALNTYLSYHSNKDQSIADESTYFAQKYFQFVDFSDPIYERLDVIGESFRTYTATLSRLGFTNEEQQAFIGAYLDKIPKDSRAYRASMLGAMNGYRGSNNDLFAQIGQSYIETYKGSEPNFTRSLGKEINSMRASLVGAEAPEISLPTPDGEVLNLSDLRGKVVLVDFWASWCRPCRAENPNVVRMYQKYKDQGFEILGVSLDRSKDAWLKAIEKDGLTWKHVSDLKYWQSEAAQTYGVSGIPYTVLLDREGKIIANKLRGRQLEQKLASIFQGD